MKKECTENEARYKAEAYCVTAERCVSEVRNKLIQWGVPQEVMNNILKRLLEERFIDEGRYAKAYAREKHRFQHWGRMKIMQALKIKQISSDLVDEALADLDREDYMESLSFLLQKKAKEVKARTEYERRGKLIRFAIGRGYEMDDIIHCLKNVGYDDEYLE